MKYEKICGIYCISNSKYFYIGHSVNIYSRWTCHRRFLRNGNHVNIIMQNVYNKYSELDPFTYEIVLECSIADLRKNEGETLLQYIYKFPNKKCMNIASPVDEFTNFTRVNGKLTKIDTELAIPLKTKNIITTKIGQAPWKWKKIVQLDKDGKLIKIWDTIKHAQKELGILIHLEKHTCGGFQWQHYDEWLIHPKGKVKHIHNIDDTIKQFSLNGQFIREFKNTTEIKKAYPNISTSSINACLNHKQKTCYNFLWSYDFKPPKYKNVGSRHNIGKRIAKYNKKGKLIEIYPSINSAAKSINVTATTIKNYVDTNKYYKGFLWNMIK